MQVYIHEVGNIAMMISNSYWTNNTNNKLYVTEIRILSQNWCHFFFSCCLLPFNSLQRFLYFRLRNPSAMLWISNIRNSNTYPFYFLPHPLSFCLEINYQLLKEWLVFLKSFNSIAAYSESLLFYFLQAKGGCYISVSSWGSRDGISNITEFSGVSCSMHRNFKISCNIFNSYQ